MSYVVRTTHAHLRNSKTATIAGTIEFDADGHARVTHEQHALLTSLPGFVSVNPPPDAPDPEHADPPPPTGDGATIALLQKQLEEAGDLVTNLTQVAQDRQNQIDVLVAGSSALLDENNRLKAANHDLLSALSALPAQTDTPEVAPAETPPADPAAEKAAAKEAKEAAAKAAKEEGK